MKITSVHREHRYADLNPLWRVSFLRFAVKALPSVSCVCLDAGLRCAGLGFAALRWVKSLMLSAHPGASIVVAKSIPILRLMAALGLAAFVAVSPQVRAADTGIHSASGTYTWAPGTGTFTLTTVASDFACDGPTVGTEIKTGVTVTTTTMSWPNDGLTWQRASGTAGNVVGTWTVTDPFTGNSYTLTLNAGGTASVVGNIVLCSSSTPGSIQVEMRTDRSAGYNAGPRQHVNIDVSQPLGTVSTVGVAGPGISGVLALTPGPVRVEGSTLVDSFIGGFDVQTGSPIQSGATYTFTITKTQAGGGGTSTFTETYIGTAVTDAVNGAINITSPSGAALGNATLGAPLSVQWTLPTAYTISRVQLNGYGMTSLTPNQGYSCWIDGPFLPPNATSGSITLPTTCGPNGDPVVIAGLSVKSDGINGERSMFNYQFADSAATDGTGTHSATGTYTYASGTLVLTTLVSNFICNGPQTSAPKTINGVTVGATTMTWPDATWTRPSGTAGVISGTWNTVDTDGNTFSLTLGADGAAWLAGNIVTCNGSGSAVKADASHWSNGYFVQLRYSDPTHSASAVSVSGPGISNSVSLTYNTNFGSWGSGTAESIINLGSTYPSGLPYSYTFTITGNSGTWTAPSTVSCFQQQFVSNLSVSGTVAGNPSFSWTGIADANAVYGVQLNVHNGGFVWANYHVTGTSITYNGPALVPGTNYDFVVSIQSSTACNNPTSGGGSYLAGNFTYGSPPIDVQAPTVPTNLVAAALSSTQINLSWSASTDNVGVAIYKVYRNATLVGSTSATSFSDTGLSAATQYSYTVTACDAATNCSAAQASAVIASTLADPSLSQFDGIYRGSWINRDAGNIASGTFTVAVTNGAMSGMLVTITNGNFGILFTSGTVSSAGAISATGAAPEPCSGSPGTFSGQVADMSGIQVMNMTYTRTGSASCGAESGVLTGIRTGTALNFIPGWNLVGNNLSGPITVGNAFGDAGKVTTVWKWIASPGRWAFYTPALSSVALANYASANGYFVLETINSGEGFWVNAASSFTKQLP